jgi:hypothetical protein
MEVVLDLIENSDYIYSRKAFDKCPLPVLICSVETKTLEYRNARFVELFGEPDPQRKSPPQDAISISRNVGGHNIHILIGDHDEARAPREYVDGTEELATWLAAITKPNRTKELKKCPGNLQRMAQSFGQVVTPLIAEDNLTLV